MADFDQLAFCENGWGEAIPWFKDSGVEGLEALMEKVEDERGIDA